MTQLRSRSVAISHIVIFFFVIIITNFALQSTQAQDIVSTDDVCTDVRYFMENRVTPYNQRWGGGVLQPGTMGSSNVNMGSPGDYWTLNITLPRDDRNQPIDQSILIRFDNVSPDLSLEVGLFSGMQPIFESQNAQSNFVEIRNSATYNYTIEADGIYTLVVHRTRIADSANVGSYQVTADFPGGGNITVDDIVNNSTNQVLSPDPRLENGIEVTLLEAQIFTHVSALRTVSIPQGEASQVYFDQSNNLLVGEWADNIHLLGGNLSVTGIDVNGLERIFYVENFGYAAQILNEPLTNFIDANDTRITLANWNDVLGTWVTNECTGVLFRDNTTFVAYTQPETRDLTVGDFTNDDCEALRIRVNATNINGTLQPHRFCYSPDGIVANSEITLQQSTFDLHLNAENTWLNTTVAEPQFKDLTLQSTNLDLFRREDPALTSYPYWNITLRDQDITLEMDWFNLKSFAHGANLPTDGENTSPARIDLAFLDEPRTTTSRDGENIARFEALNDVIRIIYRTADAEIPGREHLLLPASDSYLEIITPAGEPAYAGSALPGRIDHSPRGLNNRGGDCYPVNTLLPQANCAENGMINTANANLWYGITEHQAFAQLIDLTLIRSYNSHDTEITGPFGNGWTSNLLLDYDTAYDSLLNSRQVATESAITIYRTGLDLTWAPRGIVSFTTPSGSRHVFASSDDEFNSGVLNSLTMPGWTLTHSNYRAGEWFLAQDSGLTYVFDRAGRLLRYGYPDRNRNIYIQYPYANLNGPGNIGQNLVTITDSPEGSLPLRRLELYFNPDHQVIFSILRDLTGFDSNRLSRLDEQLKNVVSQMPQTLTNTEVQCDVSANCYGIAYRYADGSNNAILLTGVDYPDGTSASYQYDAQNRLVWHDDPRAPVAQTMRYTYNNETEPGAVSEAYILETGTSNEGDFSQSVPWRSFNTIVDGVERRVTVTEANGNQRIFTYDVSGTDLRERESTFTLLSESSPLSNTGDPFEAEPIEYTWENGLLVQVNARILRGNEGRSTIRFNYDQNGHFAGIRSGYPPLTIAQTAQQGSVQAIEITDSDGANTAYQLNENGLIESRTEPYGEVTSYIWTSDNWVEQQIGDSLRYQYIYNPLGLVTEVGRFSTTTPDDLGYRITATYDGLGRVIAIQDTLTPDGQCIRYIPGVDTCAGSPVENLATNGICDITTPITQEIHVVDPLNAVSAYRFDSRQQLVDEILFTPASTTLPFLRRTTYTYDLHRRVTSQDQCITDADGNTSVQTESYAYSDVITLQHPNDGIIREINGHSIIRTDAFGRVEQHIFDGLDRIRRRLLASGNIIDYDYEVGELERPNGLRVVERSYRENVLFSITNYLYEDRWQLYEVNRTFLTEDGAETGTLRWQLSLSPDGTTNLDSLLTIIDRDTAIRVATLNWTEYGAGGGSPSLARFTQLNDPLRPGQVSTLPALEVSYDALGNIASVLNPESPAADTFIGHCSGVEGQSATRHSIEGHSGVFDCTTEPFSISMTVDAYERPVEIRDSSGARRFTYQTASGYPHHQQITVTFESVDGTSLGNWVLIVDAGGDIVEWIDETNTLHEYRYDTLGRLLEVSIDGAPEDSYVYTYNNAGLVTLATDGYGRGVSYDYSDLGLLTVEQDTNTGNAITYLYNSQNLLSQIIDQSGSTTFYTYGDPVNPTRLTGIISPTGGQDSYIWNDDRGFLVHIDPLNRRTVYAFDALNQLRGVVDPIGQRYEYNYDSAGNLISWRQYGVDSVWQDWLTNEDWLSRLANINWESGNQILQEWNLEFSPAYAVNITETGTSNWSWTFKFDRRQALREVVNPAGQMMTFAYDSLDRLITADAGGQSNLWSLTYDNTSHSIGIDDGNGVQRQISLDTGDNVVLMDGVNFTLSDGPQVRVTYPDGAERLYIFDVGDSTTGRLPSTTLVAPGVVVTYRYNSSGLLTEIQRNICVEAGDYTLAETVSTNSDPCDTLDDPSGSAQWQSEERFIYDPAGRLTRIIDAEQQVESFTYDEIGNIVGYQNQNGQEFTYAYDNLNRLIRLTGPTGIRLLIGYNNLNQITGICQLRVNTNTSQILRFEQCNASNVLVRFPAYDRLGRVLEQTFPNEGTTASVRYDYGVSGAGLLTGWAIDNSNARATLSYSEDALSRLTSIRYATQEYTLNYRTLNHLVSVEGSGNIDLSRFPEITLNGQRFTVSSDPTQTSFVDVAGGNAFNIQRNSNGMFNQIQMLGNTLDVSATLGSRLTARDDLLIMPVERNADGLSPLELTINRLGIPEEVGTAPDFYVERNAIEQVTRNLILSPENGLTLYNDVDGYIVVNAYDNRGYPVSTRINNSEEGEQFYAVSFTYDQFGQLTNETRQYADGTVYSITYEYINQNQLTRRIVEVNPTNTSEKTTTNAEASVPLLAIFAFVMVLLRSRRSKRLMVFFMIPTLLLMISSPLFSQDNDSSIRRFVFEYSFDAAGNLELITQQNTPGCNISLTYDSINRITGIRLADSTTHSYEHDAYNRLTRADSRAFVYTTNDELPTFSVESGLLTAYGTLSDGTALFAANAQQTDWYTTDGRDIYGIYAPDAETDRLLWVFDPFGRRINFDAPILDVEFCFLNGTNATPSILPRQGGGIDHVSAGLQFFDGRAYMPDIARFLQRNPSIIDVQGQVYAFSPQTFDLPATTREDPIRRGISLLAEAQERSQRTQNVTVEAIRQQHLPHILPPVNGDYSLLHAPITRERERQDRYLSLPDWLQANYNLPAPEIDPYSGAIALPLQNMPTHGRNAETVLLDRDGVMWHTEAFQFDPVTNRTVLGKLLNHFQISSGIPTSYVEGRGQSGALNIGWTNSVALPVFDDRVFPDDVLAFMPSVLSTPVDGLDVINLSLQTRDLPIHTGADLIGSVLDNFLPALPELPPINRDEVVGDFFNFDLLDLETMQSNLAVPLLYPYLPYATNLGSIDSTWLRPNYLQQEER
ncbi:MAG: hypothetical protein RLP44_10260 [Aggregatilineales bacterium]